MFEYAGNFHIHSKYSDGAATIKEITYDANHAGLDFIVVTDHFNMKGLYNKEETYRLGVLVLVGMEINNTCNHYLALGIDREIDDDVDNPQKVVDEVNQQNGIGVIAHPVEKGSPLFQYGRTYEWNNWSVAGFQGIEIWNFLSQWRDGVTGILKGLYLLINPHAALTGPYKKTMAILDKYQVRGHRIFAYGGSDAHGTPVQKGPVKIVISPYKLCFKCINMHILTKKQFTGIIKEDKQSVYTALREGCSWVAYDYFCNSKGFRFNIKSHDAKWHIGEKVPQADNMYAEIKTPCRAKVILIKNGVPWKESLGTVHKFTNIQSGVYRVEAYHRYGFGSRPWIFSNPIWVI
ncbi:MAG: CehA/McbA family metallohydrolase [Syntrophomonadaceae bacterium]|nr:CehA/McbA family metallohydrolase [Syntrophomonadaceae bacterium]MDD3888762.1 CehA/McbA family metallohydrolase [Syntrophomonadaceae bacterium]MDD4548187.1 CehA/McbA family metallohydrolase [Syntrophomonadaceae bacterium]